MAKIKNKKTKTKLFLPLTLVLVSTSGFASNLSISLDNIEFGNHDTAYLYEAGLFPVYFGEQSIHYQGVDFNFSNSSSKATLNDRDGSKLLGMSGGFVQKLLTIDRMVWYPGANTYDTKIVGSETQRITQTVNQSGQTAVASFAVGSGAYDLLMRNQNELDVTTGQNVDPGHDNVDLGLSWENITDEEVPPYSDTGINKSGGDDAFSEQGCFSTIALLTDLTIDDNNQITITSNENANWYTSVHGNQSASIKYAGNGKNTLHFKKLNDGNQFKLNSKDFAGSTYLEKITAQIEYANALGNTALIQADNSTLKLNAGAKAGSVNFTNNSVLDLGSNNQVDVFTSDATFDNTSEITGSNAKLNVENKLTVVKDSSGLTGEVTAKEVELGAVNALGQANINVADKLTFNNVNSDEDFDNTVKATDGSFDLYALNSDVDIRSATLSAFQTTLQGTNTLVANIDQVGKTVTFNNLVADEYSTLKLQLDDQNSLNDVNLNSTFKNSIVELSGTGSDRIITVNSSNLANYAGWVRISEGTYDLNTTSSQNFNNQVGLSVGHNGTIKITGSDRNLKP